MSREYSEKKRMVDAQGRRFMELLKQHMSLQAWYLGNWFQDWLKLKPDTTKMMYEYIRGEFDTFRASYDELKDLTKPRSRQSPYFKRMDRHIQQTRDVLDKHEALLQRQP